MAITNEQYAKQYARYHAAFEKKSYPIFLKALKDSLRVVVETLNPNDIDEGVWLSAYRRVYKAVGQLSAKREFIHQRSQNPVKADDPITFYNELFGQIMEQYGYRVGMDFKGKLTETTLEQVSKALADAGAQALTRNQTARLIYEYTLGVVGRSRAMLIARTEVTTASNLGKVEGAKAYFKEIGETGGYKLWLTRLDGKERHTHQEANNEAVPFDEKFTVGGEEANAPGDPELSASERVRCRCTFVALSERQYRRRLGS